MDVNFRLDSLPGLPAEASGAPAGAGWGETSPVTADFLAMLGAMLNLGPSPLPSLEVPAPTGPAPVPAEAPVQALPSLPEGVAEFFPAQSPGPLPSTVPAETTAPREAVMLPNGQPVPAQSEPRPVAANTPPQTVNLPSGRSAPAQPEPLPVTAVAPQEQPTRPVVSLSAGQVTQTAPSEITPLKPPTLTVRAAVLAQTPAAPPEPAVNPLGPERALMTERLMAPVVERSGPVLPEQPLEGGGPVSPSRPLPAELPATQGLKPFSDLTSLAGRISFLGAEPPTAPRPSLPVDAPVPVQMATPTPAAGPPTPLAAEASVPTEGRPSPVALEVPAPAAGAPGFDLEAEALPLAGASPLPVAVKPSGPPFLPDALPTAPAAQAVEALPVTPTAIMGLAPGVTPPPAERLALQKPARGEAEALDEEAEQAFSEMPEQTPFSNPNDVPLMATQSSRPEADGGESPPAEHRTPGLNPLGAVHASVGGSLAAPVAETPPPADVLPTERVVSDVAEGLGAALAPGERTQTLVKPAPQVTLVLQPEALGTVRVTLKASPPAASALGEAAPAVSARLVVSNSQALDALNQGLPLLREQLERQGVTLERLTVQLAQRADETPALAALEAFSGTRDRRDDRPGESPADASPFPRDSGGPGAQHASRDPYARFEQDGSLPGERGSSPRSRLGLSPEGADPLEHGDVAEVANPVRRSARNPDGRVMVWA